jgi:adenosylcobinamide-phosphate synthase
VAALLVDALLGEPPLTAHPVVLMGKAISAFEREALAIKNARHARAAGALLAVTLPTLSFALVHAVLRLAPRRLRPLLEVGMLSTALSLRGLSRSALAVERELGDGNLPTARIRVGELVGRDTEHLSTNEVARAVVESVAENASDGVVAPMLYGLFFGAPGALAYKSVNTLDSMVGHPHPPYKNLGWAPARLDDLANLIPARFTVLLTAAASGSPRSAAATLEAARLYGSLTRSPNAGWSEAAFAGALQLRLGGANSYGGVVREGPILGDGRLPEARDIRRVVRLMRRACLLFSALITFAPDKALDWAGAGG